MPAQAAVDLLIDLNWLREEKFRKGNRTVDMYRINPRILSGDWPAGTDKTDNGTSVSSVSGSPGARENENGESGDKASAVRQHDSNSVLAQTAEDSAGREEFTL